MCGVAVGRLEAYYTCTGVRTWDFAAATVIVREAGGLVLDPTGAHLSAKLRTRHARTHHTTFIAHAQMTRHTRFIFNATQAASWISWASA
jgi:fructose-1,6-bisphosphatase/inositol monophosphatase family enzyme